MPFYLTFGIRIPAALVDFLSPIAFVEVREAGNPPENAPRALATGRAPPASRTLLEDISITETNAKPTAPAIDPARNSQPKNPQYTTNSHPAIPKRITKQTPPELRDLIFRSILVSARPIQSAVELLGPGRDRLREKAENGLLKSTDPRPAADIDSALLRTCYRAYEEGRDVLYGCNTFHFGSRRDIISFKDLAVGSVLRARRDSTLVSYGSHPDGRLSMIRRLDISLESGFLSRRSNIHFPVLEELAVDFGGLELRCEEDSWLNAFVRKLETFGKLRKLTVRGVSHPETLEAMREKLVRDDGEFRSVVG
ncbi:hypothetical protein G7Y79_00021g050590 [Physcia stellaris]|nr:hypothetical protein G7Y79_00021g050590 [Physcia stellaris]